MYIFTHTHACYILCIVCIYIYIYIYMIYIPGSTMVTACAFPNFLGSARQLRESRTPAADITWALPIILFDFHVWTLGRSERMWFQGSFWLKSYASNGFHSGFMGPHHPFSVLWNHKPKKAVDYRLIFAFILIVHLVLYWCPIHFFHKAIEYHCLSQGSHGEEHHKVVIGP